jgi:hypothetical protein
MLLYTHSFSSPDAALHGIAATASHGSTECETLRLPNCFQRILLFIYFLFGGLRGELLPQGLKLGTPFNH